MNKYIKICMEQGSGEGGIFYTLASFKVNMGNFILRFNDVPTVIDTGCEGSTLHLGNARLKDSRQLKERDIRNDVEYTLSYGVDTLGSNKKIPSNFEEKMQSRAIKFRHKVSDFIVAGLDIGDCSIFINYDRKAHFLIGMDILKTWDIHIGRAKSGETILLACPYNQLNDEYLSELEETFKLGALLSSAELRDSIDFD